LKETALRETNDFKRNRVPRNGFKMKGVIWEAILKETAAVEDGRLTVSHVSHVYHVSALNPACVPCVQRKGVTNGHMGQMEV